MNSDYPSGVERNASDVPVNDENETPQTPSGRGCPKGSRTINRTLTPSNALQTPNDTPTTRRRRQVSPSSQSPANKITRTANSKLTSTNQSIGNDMGSNTPSSTNGKPGNKRGTSARRIPSTRKTNKEGIDLSEIEKFWGKDLSKSTEANIYMNMEIYKDLKEKINKISRMQLVAETDSKLDEEVLNSKDEDVKEWDKMYKNTEGTEYELDYVVSCTKRKLGEEPTQILLKYEKYPRPTWEEASDHRGHELNNFRLNLFLLDRVELRLRAQWGDKYEETFPNRYLKYQIGVGQGRYITNERSIYINKIKAVQWRFNYILRKHNMEELLIEDWTEFNPETAEDDLKALRNFKFMPFPKADSEVRDLLKEYSLENEIKCTAECKTCSFDVKRKIPLKCCGMNSMLEFDEENPEIRFREKPNTDAIRERKYMTVECVEGVCECGRKCKNKESQMGRQNVYVIFKETGKGWTLRTLSQLGKAKYVGEYAGKVSVRKSSTKLSLSYDMKMNYSLRTKNNVELPPLTIRGFKCGNETRFISHSCKPNLTLAMAMVSRNGLWFAKPLFRADRVILPGEELTFDYVHEEEDAEIRVYFDYCLCGTDKCRYTKEIMDAKGPIDPELTAEWKEESEDESEDEEEGINTNNDADSGEMDDEQSRRRRRIVRERSMSHIDSDGEEENNEQNEIATENDDEEEEGGNGAEEERENDENRQPDDIIYASTADVTDDQGVNGRPIEEQKDDSTDGWQITADEMNRRVSTTNQTDQSSLIDSFGEEHRSQQFSEKIFEAVSNHMTKISKNQDEIKKMLKEMEEKFDKKMDNISEKLQQILARIG